MRIPTIRLTLAIGALALGACSELSSPVLPSDDASLSRALPWPVRSGHTRAGAPPDQTVCTDRGLPDPPATRDITAPTIEPRTIGGVHTAVQ